MPLTPELPDGAPIWIDLSTTDTTRSVAFYGEVFGWTHEISGPEFGNYVNFSHRGAMVAGMVAKNTPNPDAWTVYLKTSNAEATVEAVTAHGGIVHFDDEIPGMGSMVVLADATGVAVGAWQPGGHAGFGRVNEPSTPVWHELHTDDFATAVVFYEEAFGWTMTVMSDDDNFRMSTFGLPGEQPIAGIYDAEKTLGNAAPHWLVYFGVASADDTVATITRLGGTQLDPVVDTPFGRMSHVADPFGALFAVVEVPEVA